jgi:hypothetical protein
LNLNYLVVDLIVEFLDWNLIVVVVVTVIAVAVAVAVGLAHY